MSRILAATLGRITPRYRTFSQWIPIYDGIIASRNLSQKTLANRRTRWRYLVAALGNRTISSIRPHEIAQVIRELQEDHPHTAHRVLIEARSVFYEALANGWTDTNPALSLKQTPVKISRKRLTLEGWQKIHEYAQQQLPPWVSRMMVLALVSGQRRADLHKMRFADAYDGHLHVVQQKAGAMLRLPLDLRMEAIDTSLGEAIDACRGYSRGDELLIRKSTGEQLALASMSARFEEAREGALGKHSGDGSPPSLHECRSLAERTYRLQNVNTQRLLGHSRQAMTNRYNDDRGLSAGNWKTLEL
jgi:enterobacteria phage integrase